MKSVINMALDFRSDWGCAECYYGRGFSLNKVHSVYRYVAGRMNLISQTDTKGLNTFVGSFSLPALIFISLAELDLSSVNWMFLLSILVAKTVVFLVVIAVTFLVNRPINTGRAGLFAIFCTQSNDFAIGYPIGKYGRFTLRMIVSSVSN